MDHENNNKHEGGSTNQKNMSYNINLVFYFNICIYQHQDNMCMFMHIYIYTHTGTYIDTFLQPGFSIDLLLVFTGKTKKCYDFS